MADGRPFLEMQAIVRQAFNQYFTRNAKLREFCRSYQSLSDSGNASASSGRIPEECQVWSGESGRAWQTLAELRQDLARLGTFFVQKLLVKYIILVACPGADLALPRWLAWRNALGPY